MERQSAHSELDDDFFNALEQELGEVDVQALARSALAGILNVQDENGQSRSYQQIRQESEAFFANSTVRENFELLGALAAQYADFCAGHGMDADSQLTGGSLGDIYKLGKEASNGAINRSGLAANKREANSRRKKKDTATLATSNSFTGLFFTCQYGGRTKA